jgi:secreted trypsin-like serine protease
MNGLNVTYFSGQSCIPFSIEILKCFIFYADFAGKVHVPLDDHHRITRCSNASPGQFPWHVAIIIDNAYFCGGSLIDELWVLTAAHCA